MEVVSFGTFISFFSYYFINQDESNKKLVHLLNKVKQVRNAAAHNACMLNNLYSNNDKINYKPNRLVTRFLGNARINEEMRKSKLSNEILYQVTIVFFIHNEYVNSKSIKLNRYNEFHTLMDDSLNTANMLFLKNDLVFSSISYLHKISQYLLNSFNPIDLKQSNDILVLQIKNICFCKDGAIRGCPIFFNFKLIYLWYLRKQKE